MKVEFSQYFNLSMPIIQAPMAGADNNDLVIKVTKAGGLGSRGMGYNSAEQIIATLEDLKRNNISYYNINLFVPKLLDVDIHSNEFKRKVNQLKHYLSPICSALDVDLNDAVIFDPKQRFDEQLDVVFNENIPILSTTFGTLSPEIITACHKKNIYLIGTATTVEEAKLHEALGYDAVVLQGIEAGGHRGGFNERSLAGQMPLMTLVDSVLNQIDIPIIAAGGIRDAAVAKQYLDKGVAGLQIGTAFLACTDCVSISESYQALLHVPKVSSAITPAISGGNARGIKNKLFFLLEQYHQTFPESRLSYPFVHLITAPLRKKAALMDDAQYIAAWCGQSENTLTKVTIHEFILSLSQNGI